MISDTPRWMTIVLRAAAVYNIAWGALVVLAPLAIFRLVGVDTSGFEEPGNLTVPIWQCVGMIVGVYGVGYWFAAGDPARHWPIVLVGLLGKIFGPIGFVDSALVRGVFPVEMGWTILTNDLIWWIPFVLMLRHAWKVDNRERAERRDELPTEEDLAAVMREPMLASGGSLAGASQRSRVLVVFLRHSGCTFCKEALHELGAQREELERDAKLVLVHMAADTTQAEALFSRAGLDGVEHIADPDRRVYRAFGLGRGSIGQLFGFRVWLRGFGAGLLGRHGVGRLVGDGFQMPGAFVIENSRVVRAFRHRDAGERPDYAGMACGV